MSNSNQVPLLGVTSKDSFVRTLAAVVLPLLGLLLLSWGSLATSEEARLMTRNSAKVAVNASSGPTVKYFKESTMEAAANAKALSANPKLKALGHPNTDKAAVQPVSGSEPSVLVLPEALDQAQHAGPELKFQNYAPAVEASRSAVDILRPYSQNR